MNPIEEGDRNSKGVEGKLQDQLTFAFYPAFFSMLHE